MIPKPIAIQPTLKLQSIGFMIGSALFAIGSAPGLSDALGSRVCNGCFFVGAWFFTTAAFVQLQRSGAMRNADRALRAVWLTAATQFLGTLLFNVSTGSALRTNSVLMQQEWVWTPNAEGSAAFLISGGFALLVLVRSNALWGPRNAEWFGTWVNMLGCVAFGLSAVGAIILPDGHVRDAVLANWGTFVGAICFFLAAAVALPEANRERRGTPSTTEATA